MSTVKKTTPVKPVIKKEKSLKYRDLISESQATLQSEEKELTIQTSKSQLEMDLSASRVELSRAKQELLNTKRAIPYNVNAEILAVQKVDRIDKGIKFAESVLKERF